MSGAETFLNGGIAVLAYCAGVIDSDGTIGIKRLTYSMRVVGDSKQPTYAARICVRQVSREAVDVLRGAFGGTIRMSKPSALKGRPLFEWSVSNLIAEGALRQILPFLRIKRPQAENCIALRDIIARSKIERVAKGRGHVGASPRSAETSNAMAAAYSRAHELNRVGIQ